MQYNKLKPQKLYEQIANSIEQKIINQELTPGDRLDSVEQLAKNFEVGRSAIREALTSLQARGIIEIRQGEGSFVRKITAEDITLNVPHYASFSNEDLQQIFEVRKILELGLIENAALRRTDAQLDQMALYLNQMEQALLNTEVSSTADSQFHNTIAEATNNPLLVSMLKNVSKPISKQIQHTRALLAISNKNALTMLHNEHIAIYEAIKTGDSFKAKQAMTTHLETIENLLFN